MAKSEAQKKAQKKWDEKNRKRANYLTRRSTARGFIRRDATAEDLEELKGLIQARFEQMEEEQEV